MDGEDESAVNRVEKQSEEDNKDATTPISEETLRKKLVNEIEETKDPINLNLTQEETLTTTKTTEVKLTSTESQADEIVVSIQRQNKISQLTLLIRSRIDILFQFLWLPFVTAIIATNGILPIIQTSLAIGSSALIATSVYFYNDVIDRVMDSLNEIKKKNRPLASGKVDDKLAMRIIYVTGILGLILAWFANINSFIIGVLWITILLAYSHPIIRLKKRYLLKEIITASGIVFSCILISYAVLNSLSFTAVTFTLFISLLSFGFIPVMQDSGDEYEDKLFDVKSISRYLTWKNKILFMCSGVIIFSVLFSLTYQQMGYTEIFPISMAILSLIFLGIDALPLFGEYSAVKVRRSRNIAYVYFMLINIIFIVGKITLPF